MFEEFFPKTAQEISQGLHMKLRKHISPVALSVVAFTLLLAATTALGQELQPPFMAPTPPSLYYGALYFQAGVRYRNVDSFRFDVIAGPNTITVNPGTIPFGPTTAGPFGFALGTPAAQQFNGTSAPTLWLYDNGQVDSAVDPAPGVAIIQSNPSPPPTNLSCKGADTAWVYSVTQPELGRYQTTLGASSACTGSVPQEIGSFSIVDPTSQVNNPSSFSGTTTVTFTLGLDSSLAFALSTTPDINRVLDSNFWGPTFEAGYQYSNYFDLFYGFSWFNASNSMVLSNTIQGQGSEVTITDTFPFVSDDTSAWPLHGFNSSQDGSTSNIYQIAPNSSIGGIFPTRQFGTQPDQSIPIENIQQNISNTAEFTPLENRFGGRSWAPLFGLGRIGVTLGTAIIPTYYKISGAATYVASGSSGTVPAGTVLFAQTATQKSWSTLYGVFVGGDLSLGSERYFLTGSADYMWSTNISYELASVKTTFNPGGFTAGLNFGTRF